MKFLNLLRKNQTPTLAKKSGSLGGAGAASPSSFYEFLLINGYSNLSAYQVFNYYQQVAPLATAVDIINNECTSIFPVLRDRTKSQYIYDAPILDLLAFPNAGDSAYDFLTAIIIPLLLTGNAYVYCTATNVNKAPLEIFALRPQYVSITGTTLDAYPDSFMYSSAAQNITFKRYEINGRFRYLDESGTRELYHLKNYNPLLQGNVDYGLSPVRSIYYEVEQYIKASVHNMSLLERGGNPSGILTIDDDLDTENYDRLQQQMDQFVAGPTNAGRILIAAGGDMNYESMTMSNVELDYNQTLTKLESIIYSRYRIPLNLITTASATYNNLQTVTIQLYDFAVIPTYKRVMNELTLFLMHRYYGDSWKNFRLTFDPKSVDALALRTNDQIVALQATGAYSINELRALRGDEPVSSPGGDTIYTPSLNVPVATTDDSQEIIIDQENEQSSANTLGLLQKDLDVVAKKHGLLRADG